MKMTDNVAAVEGDITEEQINTVREHAKDEGMATREDMENKKITPAMAQYLNLKKEYVDYLLFYRMGDFYELFFEDAVTVSGALGLVLTSRSKNEGKEIPMCGVPFHAYEIYLARLIKMGYKVAICEQLEDPKEAKKRGYKAIVKRDVVRLVTPGTLTEDTLLDAKRHNYIAAAYVRPKEISVAWLDISTGGFFIQQLEIGKVSACTVLSTVLARLNPVELIVEDKLLENSDFYGLLAEYREKLSVLPKARFSLDSSKQILMKAYEVQFLEVIGNLSKSELIVAGVLLDYVENTQKGHLPRVLIPQRVDDNEIMEIDASTRKSLELLAPIAHGGISLIRVMDRTVTGIGGRLLAERLSSPIMNVKKINDRLDVVTFFLENPTIKEKLRGILSQCLDMERAVQRLSIGRGGPKDLYDLAKTLLLLPEIKHLILSYQTYQENTVCADVPSALREILNELTENSSLAEDIMAVLIQKREDLPALTRTGGFVRAGAYPPLDYLKNIREESKNKCEEMRLKYVEETGVSALKIKNNSVIGYYVEVPSKSVDALLADDKFIHRQSVLNAVRFTTKELCELENEVLSADEKALEMELKIFEDLMLHAMAQADLISKAAHVIAQLDVASGLAQLASEYGYTRPILNDSLDFEVIEGRHPVVEATTDKRKNPFVANDCVLRKGEDNLWLLTGPNMAGKSTFLRQNALITIMAQMGSYVPAKKATIGVVNKLFSRVGASDDLSRGRSTFMVEMVETATILNRADERSFVILDEIGRGTATFDGLSIAWAVVEQLAQINKCRTIFATHYHELTQLDKRIKELSLHCMAVKEFNNQVVFMHVVAKGAADRSYGIHVAKLAGMPELAVKRAEQVLQLLEEEKHHKILSAVDDELPLFEVLKKEVKEQPINPAISELQNLDIDNLSPREALEKLYDLKKLSTTLPD